LWVRNIPVECEWCKWIYERSYIWTAEKDVILWLIIAVTHNLSSCEIKAWKKFRPEFFFQALISQLLKYLQLSSLWEDPTELRAVRRLLVTMFCTKASAICIVITTDLLLLHEWYWNVVLWAELQRLCLCLCLVWLFSLDWNWTFTVYKETGVL